MEGPECCDSNTHTHIHTEAGGDAAVFFFFFHVFLYLAALGLSFGSWALCCSDVPLSGCGLDSRVPGLSCPTACGILVP